MVKIVGRGIDLQKVPAVFSPSSGFDRLNLNAQDGIQLRTSGGVDIKPTPNIGPTSFEYIFKDGAGSGDPGTGNVRFNNANPLLATILYVSKNDANNYGFATFLEAFDDGNNTSFIRMEHRYHPEIFYMLSLSSVASGGGFHEVFTCSVWFQSTTSLADNDPIILSHTTKGSFFNVMTTADDIIKGGTNGFQTRVAKGANNRVFGVDNSGVLGYKQVANADIADDSVTALVGSTLSGSTTSTTLVVPTGGTITFTSRGGSFWMLATGSIFVSAASQVIFGYSLDNASNSGALLVGTITIANINSNYPWACMYPTGAVAAGSHTHRFWWQTSAGTMTMNNGIFSVFERSR